MNFLMQVRNMRTRAIIIKKQNTNEYDQLVTCYTEEFGKVVAVAKSVLKPSSIQAMHLDLFNLVEFELISGRGTPIIAGAHAEKTFPNFKNNLNHLAVAYFFAEAADRLFFDYQKDQEIWDFFNSLLDELNHHGHHVNHGAHGDYLKDKQVEFLGILGYAPNFNECAFCSVKTAGHLTAYSVEVRGGVCQSCFLGGQKGIVLKNSEWQSPSIIGALFEALAERKLHSLNFLNSMLRLRT